MKYYSYDTWKTDPSVDPYVETLSEDEIVKEHWDWWKERMILISHSGGPCYGIVSEMIWNKLVKVAREVADELNNQLI